ncbi:MAG: hypothetical protein JJ966_14470 [Balneolaceae bacterium]|jgi:uncharacterized membrane protein (Fun14 family)|nr:hypothetical protein [Balneolaceae bacterium]
MSRSKLYTLDNQSNKLKLEFFPKMGKAKIKSKSIKSILLAAFFILGFLQLYPLKTLFVIFVLIIGVFINSSWSLMGKETVLFDTNELKIIRSISYLQSTLTFSLDELDHLTIGVRKKDKDGKDIPNTSMFNTNGIFQFQHKGINYNFGLDIEIEEAYLIYKEIANVTRFSDLNIRLD